MAEATLRTPPPLDLASENLEVTWKTWKRQVEFYLIASGADQKGEKVQTAIILHCAGPEVQEIYEHFEYSEGENKDDPAVILKKLEEYCAPQTGEVIATHRFWTEKYKEPIDAFVVTLKTRAKMCNFKEPERMIRDKIVFSVEGKMQELLLREKTLDLQKAIDICRSYEITSKQKKEMQTQHIDKVEAKGGAKTKSDPTYTSSAYIKDCRFCGKDHKKKKEFCPAWGETCRKCSKKNHFEKKCTQKVHMIEQHEEENQGSSIQGSDRRSTDPSRYNFVSAVGNSSKKRITALMTINDREVRFQLDSAADVNTICQKYVHASQIRPTQQKLTMWNGTIVKPKGEAVLNVQNPKTNTSSEVRFTVVDDSFTCLLGVSTVQELGLITVNREAFIAKVTSESLGDLGETTLTVERDAKPKALPSRRIPIALQQEVKDQLDSLVERGVLVPVEEPTPWVSQMAITRKDSDGSLRICIDPQALNAVLVRERYKLPTLDDILPKLQQAKVFSKLDVKEAFWHVRLDKESSLLTTMGTPFGRYRWARLPFGLSVSSEIFQRRLTQALEGLDGVVCVADDIIVYGSGETNADADRQHQANLEGLQKRCEQRNIRLNNKKAEIKRDKIKFMGHLISAAGIEPDPSKVQAINDMPPPTDVHGVRRLCGMVQYLARFLPNLAEELEPIRALTKKEKEWEWSTECQEALDRVKKKITSTPTLAYFDENKELVLQVDSSKDGLGAALMQGHQPIEYASRALTSSERNWAQIEKELLSVVYGLERFDQYTFGRTVRIQNDHKPLASILKKPMSQASRRIQSLMMRLHRYDVVFEYIPGPQLLIADTLSRAFLPEAEGSRVFAVNSLLDLPNKTFEEVKRETEADRDMQMLKQIIKEGWPENKEDVPESLRAYFDIRDTLGEQDGILLKGERVIIPRTLRRKTKETLHAAHLGYDSMMRRARETVFWPGMGSEIKQMAEHCEPCAQMKPENPRETLIQHDDGGVPFRKVGTDLFELEGRHYLVLVDYFTNLIEVDQLKLTTSQEVINKMRVQFARYGIPAELVSDNASQFASEEFQNFLNDWGITHTTSSPLYPKANGKAEAAVKTLKHIMTKCSMERTNVYYAILELRNTPRQDTGLSPNQMMFGRSTRTKLPTATNNATNSRQVREAEIKREKRQKVIKRSHDKSAKDLKPIYKGQCVFYKHKAGERWKKGEIVGEHEANRSYMIKGENGGVYRRNRVHIRPTSMNTRYDGPGQRGDLGSDFSLGSGGVTRRACLGDGSTQRPGLGSDGSTQRSCLGDGSTRRPSLGSDGSTWRPGLGSGVSTRRPEPGLATLGHHGDPSLATSSPGRSSNSPAPTSGSRRPGRRSSNLGVGDNGSSGSRPGQHDKHFLGRRVLGPTRPSESDYDPVGDREEAGDTRSGRVRRAPTWMKDYVPE